uniref:Retrovirus-related Pol polyprotein from transposon TNT 1-94 n=1 Tax=Cajanus cajan TaxID=3821 RepID=A0A151QUK0_CAJCA|nr:Retrovirus-related Pol polyprotein from transposon TNT 1-94 [Cajanus cajan]
MLFLMGLNEGYSHIRGQILLMDPIPPIEKGFSLVLQEEKQQELGIPTNSNDTPTAFAYKSGNDAKSRTNNPTKERPKCEHCGKLGHIKDKCFKLHGYPTHLKQGNSNTNVNQVSDKSAKAFQFTTDQYHQILSLLQNQPSSNCIESNPIVNGLLLSIRPSFNSIPSTKWILDSGASTHVACSLSLFKTYKIIKNRHVTLPNQSHIPVCGIGTVYLDQDIVLKDVIYVPQFQYNLLSINCLLKHNSLSLLFISNKFILQDILHNKMIGAGEAVQGVYLLNQLVNPASLASVNINSVCFSDNSLNVNSNSASVNSTCTKDAAIWHSRFGHVNDTVLKILSNKIPFSMPTSYSSSSCHICPISKFRKLPFVSHNNFCSTPFDLVHCDVWGPYRLSTYNSMRYFLTLVDDHSRFTWIHLLRTKAEATSAIKSFFNLIHTQFGVTIKQLRSDNAKELALVDFLKDKGTIHQFSCVERPQQNAVVERKHQHLLSVARALYYQSKIPLIFWGDCVTTTAFLINRMPSPNNNNNSPYLAEHE